MIDPLTRLGNRRYLQHRLKQELALSARQQTPLSVVQIEVYQFNQLFVQLGKRRADMVLMKLAQVLRSVVRKEDSLARSSVAQFTVLLPSARAEGALRFVDRAMKVSEKLAFQHRGKAQRLPLNIAVHTPSSLGNSSPGQVGKVLEEYMKNARNGGANAVVSDGDEARQQPDARPVLTVEQALALLQSGKEHVVVNALPDLKRQLMPLLQLMRRESTGRETV